jgi:iron complex outermembrane recepter protein
MYRLLMISIFMLTSALCMAQYGLSGHVTSENQSEEIQDAVVYIPELAKGTTTDSMGYFVLSGLPPRMLLIEIVAVGFSSQVVKANPSDASSLVISLSHSAAELNAIVVTGTSTFSEQKNSPISTVTLHKADLIQNNSTNLIDALANTPGISQISSGPAISKPMIRGLGYNRVVVLRNGMRQEGQQWGDEHGIEMDEYEVDAVEIIKGPGSIIYGSDAMAGVINFMTPRVLEEGKVKINYLSEFQSNNHLIGNSLMHAGNLHGVHWLVRGSQKYAGNYSNPVDGYVLNSGYKEWDASGNIGLLRNWGNTQIQFSSFNQNLGLVEGERDSLGHFILAEKTSDSTLVENAFNSDQIRGYKHSIGVPSQQISHHRISLNSNLYIGHSKLSLDIAFQQNNRKEFGDVFSPSNPGLYFKLNTLNTTARYALKEWKKFQIVIGANQQFQQSFNKGSEFLIPAYSAQDLGGFVFTTREMKRWHLSAGIRYDLRWLKSTALFLDENNQVAENGIYAYQKFVAFNRTFQNYSATLGFTFSPSEKLNWRWNVAKAFRIPNLAELGSNGVHEGTFRYEIGNQDLKAESSLQSDAGVTYLSKHFTMDASVFANRIDHYTYIERLNNQQGTDSVSSFSEGFPLFQFVQGNALLYGGECSFDFHPHPIDELHLQASFSYVRGQQIQQKDTLSNLPFMPAPKFQFETRWEMHAPRKRIKAGYVKLGASVFLPQNNVLLAYDTETTTPGYSLVNLGCGGELLDKKRRTIAQVVFSISNLLNEDYVSHLSRLKYAPINPLTNSMGIYNAGRNFGIKLIFPINL